MDLSGRIAALQVQSPEFKPQSCKKQKQKHVFALSFHKHLQRGRLCDAWALLLVRGAGP
jgi:hypothetical protein